MVVCLFRLQKSSCTKLQDAFTHRFSTSSMFQKVIPSNLKGRSKGSQEWLKRQINDPYVKKAQIDNYRCRSAYKLIEIDDKFKLLKPGYTVIDCGAAPGSWCQVAIERVSKNGQGGKVIGVDLQHFEPIKGVHIFSKCDFTDVKTQSKLLEVLDGKKVDIILSDMAPNASGIKSCDHEQIMHLCITVLKFSLSVLKPGGSMLCKVWPGSDQKVLEKGMSSLFETVQPVKPAASRSDSSELFLLARQFKHITK